ncbi:TetR/AcrR family transcriptional regulator [Sphingobium sp. HBC34]|uniref:TetR/AcrR family transcriptional regulator n=1 Tax=Sphingobium cyanobacteriorum TaxID=3063954 RepID=A0ABT8ZHQ5_9SPHN|nr:TetR/AcrR family transcriptional regulator [Sphingobium sp. HBC34]MDO7833736.1 TetR/AcrR family transcriptional regulator [Sphingobium sp. HBC34]
MTTAEASREPQQGRSRASYERMLTAAEKLMVKGGNDDFTLTEVAKVGKVSIGSIYLRFDSKDDLIRAVHARVLARIDADQDRMMQKIDEQAATLEDFARAFVDAYAELLKSYSPVLRPIMFRAIYDESISALGRDSAEKLTRQAETQMLRYASEFGRPDHARLVSNAFRMIYYTLARFLGLGSSPEAAHQGNWEEIKEDLAIMCAAFLRAPGPS